MNKKMVFLFALIFSPILVSASLTDFLFENTILSKYSTDEIIYLYVLPFIGTFAITFGLLIKLNLFKDTPQVNIILSFIFGLALLYTGIMLKVSRFLYGLGGFAGTLAFFIIFIIGVWKIGKDKVYTKKVVERKLEKEEKKLKEKENDLGKVEKRLKGIQSKIQRMSSSPEAKKRLMSLKSKLEQRKVDLEGSINEIRERVRNITENVRGRVEETTEK